MQGIKTVGFVVFLVFTGCKNSKYDQLKQDILQANIDACTNSGLYSKDFCECAMQIAYDWLEKDGEQYYKILMNPPKGNSTGEMMTYINAQSAINAKYKLVYDMSFHLKKCK